MMTQKDCEVRGLFGQVLNAGDIIAFMSRSYGSDSLKICEIYSIEFKPSTRMEMGEWDWEQRNWIRFAVPKEITKFEPFVKIHVYIPDFKTYVWHEDKSEVVVSEKHYIKRIFNYETAITLKPVGGKDNFSLDNRIAQIQENSFFVVGEE